MIQSAELEVFSLSGLKGKEVWRAGYGQQTGFLSLPLSTPSYRHPAWGEGLEERVLDESDPPGLELGP